jgi:hypothetical protein
LGTEEELMGIMSNLIAANSSISDTDKADVKWALNNYSNQLDALLPETIPQKETIAFVAGELIQILPNAEEFLKPFFKTATDVLRLAVALSAGDVSLAKNTKFRNFKRGERRFLLSLLENIGFITEDMRRYEGPWIRLGEKLHPSEYMERFPKCHKAFDILRNDLPFATFNNKVEKALLAKKPLDALALLASRPGELARRLDHLLRISTGAETTEILTQFQTVAEKISTPVLLQVFAHFKHRNSDNELRAYFPKGNAAKVKLIENELPALSDAICEAAVTACSEALKARFAKLPPLGKVYVDSKLKNHLLPFSQRSASKALRTLVRGSRIDMPTGDTIRFFLWWKEGEINGKHTGRVDIDLSSVLFDANWRYKEHISYTNLVSANYKAAHSGDITSAPYGACEFIDIDIPSVLRYGGRYVIMNINSYTSQAYCNLPECYAGWMMRQHPGSGEIFEPKTVVDKVDLAANTKICIPVILDLQTRQVVWTDLGLKAIPSYAINLENNLSGITLIGMAMTTLEKATLYELFELHAQARGTLVDKAEAAETVFAEHQGITPFDIEKIMAEFMA